MSSSCTWCKATEIIPPGTHQSHSYSNMKYSPDLVVIALLALQSAPRNTFVARAQQSGNTDGTSSNATLDVKYPSRVMTAPSQFRARDLNREGVCIQVKDVHSILRNKVLSELKLEGKLATFWKYAETSFTPSWRKWKDRWLLGVEPRSLLASLFSIFTS